MICTLLLLILLVDTCLHTTLPKLSIIVIIIINMQKVLLILPLSAVLQGRSTHTTTTTILKTVHHLQQAVITTIISSTAYRTLPLHRCASHSTHETWHLQNKAKTRNRQWYPLPPHDIVSLNEDSEGIDSSRVRRGRDCEMQSKLRLAKCGVIYTSAAETYFAPLCTININTIYYYYHCYYYYCDLLFRLCAHVYSICIWRRSIIVSMLISYLKMSQVAVKNK